MMTLEKPGYTKSTRRPDVLKTRFSVFAVFALALWSASVYAKNSTIKAGEWKGTFLTHDGKLQQIKYTVSHADGSAGQTVKIKLIYTDFEPVFKHTYPLTDIKIGKKKIHFKIPKEHETKACELKKKKKNSYAGTCVSTAGSAEEKSEITMELVKAAASNEETSEGDTVEFAD